MRGLSASAGLVGVLIGTRTVHAQERPCSDSFTLPLDAPQVTTQYNGIQLKDVCITKAGPHHFQALGDWGGVLLLQNTIVLPADRRSRLFPGMQRQFVAGVDDKAQRRVAHWMQETAKIAPPDFVLNLGDMFYWTGVDGNCGGPPLLDQMSLQFRMIFEDFYNGPLASTPFLGVLGNHDYGGFKFTAAWQETIGYSWGGNLPRIRRWVLPALYWAQRVRYPGFSVDLIFVDTNSANAFTINDGGENLCGFSELQDATATCGNQGPPNLNWCHAWFQELMKKQVSWLVWKLTNSMDSTFQIVVAHHPPTWHKELWACLALRFGIDLFVSGHIHMQKVYAVDAPDNPLPGGTCTIVSGGGGGITSEGVPSQTGLDDMYGFMDVELAAAGMKVRSISHGGIVRSTTWCPPRAARPEVACAGRRLSEGEDSLAHLWNASTLSGTQGR